MRLKTTLERLCLCRDKISKYSLGKETQVYFIRDLEVNFKHIQGKNDMPAGKHWVQHASALVAGNLQGPVVWAIQNQET